MRRLAVASLILSSSVATAFLAYPYAGGRASSSAPLSAKGSKAALKTATDPLLTNRARVPISAAASNQAVEAGLLRYPVRSLLAVPYKLQYGQYVWNETGVPSGATWIRVDLTSQLISVFRAGHEIGTAVILYGGNNKQTPTGTFPVLSKAREHRSSLYDADMPYTLRLTGDGVSIHGSYVRPAAASHGCIGVPLPFARKLFGNVTVGDQVLIIASAPQGSLSNEAVDSAV